MEEHVSQSIILLYLIVKVNLLFSFTSTLLFIVAETPTSPFFTIIKLLNGLCPLSLSLSLFLSLSLSLSFSLSLSLSLSVFVASFCSTTSTISKKPYLFYSILAGRGFTAVIGRSTPFLLK